MSCISDAGHDSKTIEEARLAVSRYPESLALHSFLLFHHNSRREWDDSIELGRQVLASPAALDRSDLVLTTHNNFVWASLWVDGDVSVAEQLAHVDTLEAIGHDCATLHTSIFVVAPVVTRTRETRRIQQLGDLADAFLSTCVTWSAGQAPPGDQGAPTRADDLDASDDARSPMDLFAALCALAHTDVALGGALTVHVSDAILERGASEVARAHPGGAATELCALHVPWVELREGCERRLTGTALRPAAPPSR